ncbi:citrate synthase [Myriangium duriaei CBS 260.36]|uniref:Citrate synthase n=1 Tax=Myriangium duriaei CBS 260.36 TaxID=1168546 RepID=A0A9P4J077_9PEZI|nr:citrate synthase [Myriangium duriaei CBS 260.36]
MFSLVLRTVSLSRTLWKLLTSYTFPIGPQLSANCLYVTDSRTGQSYNIKIHDGNYVDALDVAKIATLDWDGGKPVPRLLRILDHGFNFTACMKSSITHIDGQRGTLKYKGHSIQDLFHDRVYEEVMYLLIWGNFPSDKQKVSLRKSMAEAMVPHQVVVDVITAFPPKAETVTMVLAGLSAFLSSDTVMVATHHQQRPMFHGNLAEADAAIIRTIAYFASSIALVYCHKHGKSFAKPLEDKSLVQNILVMIGIDNNPQIEKVLTKLWILYADHEMTNSTAATLHAASTLNDPMSAIMAGLASGWGPLHGGAIDLAYEGFREIGSVENIPAFIDRVKAKKARLFGYGHRVYRTRDPRLGCIEQLIDENRAAVYGSPLLSIAMGIDKVATEDSYFTSRNLKANADLLGCFLYTALGFDTDMITVLICLSRVPGGLAHWRETLEKPIRLWRPQQIYEAPSAVNTSK